jgi:hypothetical protein
MCSVFYKAITDDIQSQTFTPINIKTQSEILLRTADSEELAISRELSLFKIPDYC